ncbi:MAG: hypothetical protein GEV06_06285 [Luteitalea sp.]|nr:hypothetical protein [Luteitalea sp.]
MPPAAGTSPQAAAPSSAGDEAALPGGRVLLDAHNCYPYSGRWTDRVDRALATGAPLAIEQDLIWYTDTQKGTSRSVVAHGLEEAPSAPSLREHFFERVRPYVERALAEQRRGDWPLITLNLDLKSDEPEHHAAIWTLLGEYEAWLTTAVKDADPARVMPLDVKPLLVLTGSNDAQQKSFHDRLPIGTRLRVFGATRVPPPSGTTDEERLMSAARATPEVAIGERATNYRRWVNFPWAVVEAGGQVRAAEWTTEDSARLQALVDRAHAQGLWIRFYTLNGSRPETSKALGWTASYNFGSLDAVQQRWRASIEAGVDFVATDQYEDFTQLLSMRDVTKPSR